jgi:hypothetical protein
MNKLGFSLLSIGIGILSLLWTKFAPAKWIEPFEGKFRSKIGKGHWLIPIR